jgi:hypothetical protein
MSKYQRLEHFLLHIEGPELWLSFSEIETKLGFKLPQSARLHRGWWANEPTTHVQARAWLNADWKVWLVNLSDQKVHLVRQKRGAPHLKRSVGTVAEDSFVVDLRSLSGSARTLLERHANQHACSFSQATADLLAQAAIDRKRRLLGRFPHSGERSSVDSVDLIREERDARDAC